MAPTRSSSRDTSAHASSHQCDQTQIYGNGELIHQAGDHPNVIAGSAHSPDTESTTGTLSTHATQLYQPRLRSRGSQASIGSLPSLASSEVTLESDELDDAAPSLHQQYRLPSLSRSTSPASSLASSSSSSSIASNGAIPSSSFASGVAPYDARSDGYVDADMGLPDATDHFAWIGAGVGSCCDVAKKDNTATTLDLPDATDPVAEVGAQFEDVVLVRGHAPAAAF